MNGIINVYKEKGFTSHDVVAKLRGILKTRKIGHTGTLDPDACGVLPVCIGSATKACEFITAHSKSYRAVLLLGKTTDTYDITGNVVSECECNVTNEEIISIVNSFVGKIAQIPPMYSAIKVNGKKLYELAREGKTIERKPREVEIFKIDILDMDLPRVTMDIFCSKGTYIRSLCSDIGERAGCGGCMESLVRTGTGRFGLDTALKLQEIEDAVKAGTINEHVIKVDEVFFEHEKITIKKDYNKLLYNGNKMPIESICTKNNELGQNNSYRVYDHENSFMGLYEYIEKEKSLKPIKLFMEQR